MMSDRVRDTSWRRSCLSMMPGLLCKRAVGSNVLILYWSQCCMKLEDHFRIICLFFSSWLSLPASSALFSLFSPHCWGILLHFVPEEALLLHFVLCTPSRYLASILLTFFVRGRWLAGGSMAGWTKRQKEGHVVASSPQRYSTSGPFAFYCIIVTSLHTQKSSNALNCITPLNSCLVALHEMADAMACNEPLGAHEWEPMGPGFLSFASFFAWHACTHTHSRMHAGTLYLLFCPYHTLRDACV